MNTCRIFVVRHGQSTHNRDGIISGHADDPALTEEGKAQARQTMEKLSHITFDVAYSSDLQRAAHTAEIIYGEPVHETRRLPGLREREFGSLDGKPNHHLTKLREDPKYLSMSHQERWSHKFADDMESDKEVAERFEHALTEIAKQNMGKTVLVAAHGGTMRTVLIHLGYAKPQELPSQSIDNAAYAELIYDGDKFSFGEMSGVNKQTAE